MDIQLTAAVIFLIGILIFLYINRKKVRMQSFLFPLIYFVMYKTSWGIKWMDKIANKLPRTLRFISILGVIIGFLGMIFISTELIISSANLLLNPTAPASVKPVLPFEAKGVFFVPFIYWITAIFVIATAHEFAHGVISRVIKVPVKSSGIAFLGIIIPIIPAAFVEPDEKKLASKKTIEQLAVYGAGAFANITLAGFFFLTILFIINPLASKMIDYTGIDVRSVTSESPAETAGLTAGERITKIESIDILTLDNFTAFLKQTKPGQRIEIQTNTTTHALTIGTNEKNKPYLGITVAQATQPNKNFVKKYGETTTALLKWTFGLLYWLFMLNLGIGLFNLVPLGPIDGGRMLNLVLTTYLPQKLGKKTFHLISTLLLGLILMNVIIGFVRA